MNLGGTSFVYAMELLASRDRFDQLLAELDEFNVYMVVASLVWLANDLASITGHDLSVELGSVLPDMQQREGEKAWLELRQP